MESKVIELNIYSTGGNSEVSVSKGVEGKNKIVNKIRNNTSDSITVNHSVFIQVGADKYKRGPKGSLVCEVGEDTVIELTGIGGLCYEIERVDGVQIEEIEESSSAEYEEEVELALDAINGGEPVELQSIVDTSEGFAIVTLR